MDWQTLSGNACVKQLHTDPQKGLNTQQVKKSTEQYGKNELVQKKKKSLMLRFLAQFSDFMVIILLFAAGISFVTSYIQNDADYIDSIIILLIVVINAVTGVIQESRAEKAIDALKKMASPQTQVLRNGKQSTVSSASLVPGDIVVLEAGDLVPADLRILESSNLKAEESSLTGESTPSDKDGQVLCTAKTPIGDQKNMLFAGSSIVQGRAKGVVVATAMSTQVGKIAHMINQEETPATPLQQKLAHTGKILGIGAIIICLFIFIMGIFQNIPPLDMFVLSISLAVAAIPEGLPAVVTIVLAMGVRRMAGKRAIIRRLPAVETLGSASVICSDKTGTLTQNKMTVVELANMHGKLTKSSGQGTRLLHMAALCSNATVQTNGSFHGSPTEAAILNAAGGKDSLEKSAPRIDEIPFSSARKMMTTIHKTGEKGYTIITKGAPDLLLEKCSAFDTGSSEEPLTDRAKKSLLAVNEEMAERALRVIGVAYRQVSTLPDKNSLEQRLVFCGFIGIIDPPRPQAAQAVRLCRQAGIRAVMITGDHAATAAAIAKQLGMMQPGDQVVTGAQLEQISQKELEKVINRYTVFARVSPEHKVRIVKAFQANGEVVAMTGDGINDAPALKAADIGCAMGITGTDVAKEAADMIMTDDNFSTIVSAVREGRGIYENIKRTIHFLISCNIGEILTVFTAFFLHLPAPLLAIQLLWVNLVTDSLPALALGVEPISDDIMKRKPVQPKQSVFAGGAGFSIIIEGCFIGALSLLAYTIGRVFFDFPGAEPVTGRTMAFAVLSLSQLAHTFNMRSQQSVFKLSPFSNPKLLWAALVCIVLQISVIAAEPLSHIFKTVPLTGGQWGIVAALSVLPLLVVELEKKFFPQKNVQEKRIRNPKYKIRLPKIFIKRF